MNIDSINRLPQESPRKQKNILILGPLDRAIKKFLLKHKAGLVFWIKGLAGLFLILAIIFLFFLHRQVKNLTWRAGQAEQLIIDFGRGELPVECLRPQGNDCPDKEFRKIIPYLLEITKETEKHLLEAKKNENQMPKL